MRQNIREVLALSDGRGQPVVGKEQDWIDLVVKIVKGMGDSLKVDGVMQLGDLDEK